MLSREGGTAWKICPSFYEQLNLFLTFAWYGSLLHLSCCTFRGRSCIGDDLNATDSTKVIQGTDPTSFQLLWAYCGGIGSLQFANIIITFSCINLHNNSISSSLPFFYALYPTVTTDCRVFVCNVISAYILLTYGYGIVLYLHLCEICTGI